MVAIIRPNAINFFLLIQLMMKAISLFHLLIFLQFSGFFLKL